MRAEPEWCSGSVVGHGGSRRYKIEYLPVERGIYLAWATQALHHLGRRPALIFGVTMIAACLGWIIDTAPTVLSVIAAAALLVAQAFFINAGSAYGTATRFGPLGLKFWPPYRWASYAATSVALLSLMIAFVVLSGTDSSEMIYASGWMAIEASLLMGGRWEFGCEVLCRLGLTAADAKAAARKALAHNKHLASESFAAAIVLIGATSAAAAVLQPVGVAIWVGLVGAVVGAAQGEAWSDLIALTPE